MIKNVKLFKSNWDKLFILKNGIPSLAGAVMWPKWDKTLCTACETAFFLVFSNTTSDRYAYTCSIKINTRWKKSIFYFPSVMKTTCRVPLVHLLTRLLVPHCSLYSPALPRWFVRSVALLARSAALIHSLARSLTCIRAIRKQFHTYWIESGVVSTHSALVSL